MCRLLIRAAALFFAAIFAGCSGDTVCYFEGAYDTGDAGLSETLAQKCTQACGPNYESCASVDGSATIVVCKVREGCPG